jgi:hypothetical protein
VSDDLVELILTHNPRRAFTFATQRRRVETLSEDSIQIRIATRIEIF